MSNSLRTLLAEKLRAALSYNEQETFEAWMEMPRGTAVNVLVEREHARLAPLHELLIEVAIAADEMCTAADQTWRMHALTNGASGVSVNVNYGAVHDALAKLREAVESK